MCPMVIKLLKILAAITLNLSVNTALHAGHLAKILSGFDNPPPQCLHLAPLASSDLDSNWYGTQTEKHKRQMPTPTKKTLAPIAML